MIDIIKSKTKTNHIPNPNLTAIPRTVTYQSLTHHRFFFFKYQDFMICDDIRVTYGYVLSHMEYVYRLQIKIDRVWKTINSTLNNGQMRDPNEVIIFLLRDYMFNFHITTYREPHVPFFVYTLKNYTYYYFDHKTRIIFNGDDRYVIEVSEGKKWNHKGFTYSSVTHTRSESFDHLFDILNLNLNFN